MSQLAACLVKELRLVTRDLHGLVLLFLLPLTFILVMSLALRDAFDARAGRGLDVLLHDSDGSEDARRLASELGSSDVFAMRSEAGTAPAGLVDQVRRGDVALAIEIEKGLQEWLATGLGQPITIIVGPNVDRRTEIIFVNTVSRALAVTRTSRILAGLGHRPSGPVTPGLRVIHSYGRKAGGQPSAVQQNVPAWLVFAVFFVAIPFSNTFIRERQVGTFRRLRAMAVSPIIQFLGKLGPYFVINQLQVVAMLSVGVFLVPLLGGDALELNGSMMAFALLAMALSVAALGLALLIAVIARTTEQATMVSGLGNIVLAAIGGVMVPQFVMPPAMLKLASLSPMAWGLDGFLVLLLHDGGVADIVPQLLELGGFGLAAMALAWLRFGGRDS